MDILSTSLLKIFFFFWLKFEKDFKMAEQSDYPFRGSSIASPFFVPLDKSVIIWRLSGANRAFIYFISKWVHLIGCCS